MAQGLLGLAQGILRLALGGDVAPHRLKEIVRRDRAPFDAAAPPPSGGPVLLDSLGRALPRPGPARAAAPTNSRTLAPSSSGSCQPSKCVQAGLTELIVPSRPATIMTSVDS